MKYTIREGVYETNSSSMHSIAVMKNSGPYTQKEIMSDIYLRKGTWKVYRDDDLSFGRWPFRVLTSFKDKVMYTIAEYAGSYKPYNEGCKFIDEVLVPIIEKYVPGFEKFDLPIQYETAYNDQDGNPLDVDEVEYCEIPQENGSYEYGYGYKRDGKIFPAVKTNEEWTLSYFGEIDHQSLGLLNKFLQKEGITLEDFIINRQYIVIIDGDEYYDWLRYKTMGIINTAGIDHEYPSNDDIASDFEAKWGGD